MIIERDVAVPFDDRLELRADVFVWTTTLRHR